MSIADLIEQVIRYEEGEMSELETVDLFQQLIDTGLAWQLQSHYRRMAQRLIHEGLCVTT